MLEPNEMIIKRINPWGNVISSLFIALMVSFVNIFEGALGIMINVVAITFVLLSYSRLRRENKSFFVGIIVCVLYIALQIFLMYHLVVPYDMRFDNYGLDFVYDLSLIAYIGTMLMILILVCFRIGISKYIKYKIDLYTSVDMLILYEIYMMIAVKANGGIYGVRAFIMIIIYMILAYRLYVLKKNIIDEGYNIKLSRRRIATPVALCIVVISYVIVFSISSVKANSSNANETLERAKIYNETELTQIRANLITMGFPEEVLNCIADSDLEFFAGAKAVYIRERDEIIEEIDGDKIKWQSVFVEMSDNCVYGIIFYKWLDDCAYWNDAFSFTCDSGNVTHYSGKMLYEHNGTTYISSMNAVKSNYKEHNDDTGEIIFNGSQIISEIGYPKGSTNQRGYLFVMLDGLENIKEHSYSFYMYMCHMSHPFRNKYIDYEQARGYENLFTSPLIDKVDIGQYCNDFGYPYWNNESWAE